MITHAKQIAIPFLIAFYLLMGILACTDAERANYFGSLGSEHTITLYSCGKVVGQWTSTGKVTTEEHSDGYIFVNKATGKFVRISGTLVIEQR